MEMSEKTDLSRLITNCLCLEMNTNTAIRTICTPSQEDRFSKMAQQEAYDILGEHKFTSLNRVPDHVIGSPIQEFYRGVNVFITGGTGFCGKVLIEKLVRSIPHLGHIYLLIRAKRGKTPQERLDHLLEDRLFLRMKTEVCGYRKMITAVDGDISQPGLALSAADRLTLTDTVHVVFHSAADVRFIEPLRSALESNVLGSKNVLDLAKQMKTLKAYVHVSTAYSQCVNRVVYEEVPKMSINYKEVLREFETKTDEELEEYIPRMMQGWPNTYVFSKAVCEDMLQEEAGDLPICIFRPSVVCSTFKEPVRGWTDNVNGSLGVLLGFTLGVIHCFLLDLALGLDIVPVDYVVNCMIAASYQTGTRRIQKSISVYNFTLTQVKPISWKRCDSIAGRYKDVWPFSQSIWYHSPVYIKSPLVFNICNVLLHHIPGTVLDKLAKLGGQKPRLRAVYQKMDDLRSQLFYFTHTIWEFKNEHVMAMWNELSKRDRELFYFDLRDVDMEEYVLLGKLGMRYYLLREKMEDLPAAARRYKRLKWIHLILKSVFGLAVLKVLVSLAHVLPI